MKPTEVVVTIPIKGWSKHDSPAEAAEALRDMVKTMLKLFDRSLSGGSPFDAEHVDVEMRTTSSKD